MAQIEAKYSEYFSNRESKYDSDKKTDPITIMELLPIQMEFPLVLAQSQI